MAKATKLPSGNWFCRPYLGKDANNKHVYGSVTAPTKKQAELDAAMLKHKYKMDAKKAEIITLNNAIERYIQAKEAILSPKTIREYRAIQRRAFDSILTIDINTMTTEQFQVAVNLYAANHSPKSVRNAVGLAKAAIAMFAPDKRLHVSLPQPKKTKLTIPTDLQLKQLIDNADPFLKTAILFASALGLRRSEICALTFADFDAKKGTINIDESLVMNQDGGWTAKGTKTTSSTRTLPVPAFLAEHIQSLPRDKERMVPVTPDSISYRFITLRNKLGLSFRFHDLRHYYASLLLALGVPDKYAMQRMGHSTTNMLKNVYQHIISEKQDEVTSTINQALQDKFS